MNDCIFCKIIDKEIPSDIVYEDDLIMVIHDISKMAPVHCLVLPKVHVSSLNAIEQEQAKSIAHAFSKIPYICEKLGIKESGYRTIINTGSDAGQTVKHIHIHILGGTKLPEKMA